MGNSSQIPVLNLVFSHCQWLPYYLQTSRCFYHFYFNWLLQNCPPDNSFWKLFTYPYFITLLFCFIFLLSERFSLYFPFWAFEFQLPLKCRCSPRLTHKLTSLHIILWTCWLGDDIHGLNNDICLSNIQLQYWSLISLLNSRYRYNLYFYLKAFKYNFS